MDLKLCYDSTEAGNALPLEIENNFFHLPDM